METGKGKCPFEPSQRYTAVMAGKWENFGSVLNWLNSCFPSLLCYKCFSFFSSDGILYTAATSNFLGTSYDICRATGPEQERVRTDQSINWLNGEALRSSTAAKYTHLTLMSRLVNDLTRHLVLLFIYSDPEFVSSALIEQAPDSNPTGDDDKIYFFFTEMAKEHDLYTKVPRVVRVCKVTQRFDEIDLFAFLFLALLE